MLRRFRTFLPQFFFFGPRRKKGRHFEASPLASIASSPRDTTRGMLWGLIVAIVVLLFLGRKPLNWRLEQSALDAWFTLRGYTSPTSQPSEHVVILAADDATLRRWDNRLFDSRDIGELLRLLKKRGASAAALAWPLLANSQLTPSERNSLAGDIRASGIACLPLGLLTPGTIANSNNANDSLLLQRYSALVASRFAEPPTEELRLQAPDADLLRAAASAGHNGFTLDSDGRVRRLPVWIESQGAFYPPLSVSAAVFSTGDVELTAASHALPLLSDGTMLLNYPTGVAATPEDATQVLNNAFRTYSIAQVLQFPQLLPNLNGTCVIIGPTSSMLSLFSTPSGARVPATTLHAVVADNLLSGENIERAPTAFVWLVTIILCLTVGGFVSSRPPLWSAIVTGLSMVAVAALSLGLFLQNIWLDVSLPGVASGATFLIGVMGWARRQERESTRIKSAVEALRRGSDIIATRTDPHQTLRQVLGWASSALGTEAAVALLQDENGTLHLTAAHLSTSPRRKVPQGALTQVPNYEIPLGEGIAGWTARHDRPAIVNDKNEERLQQDAAIVIVPRPQGVLCVPLRARDRLLGVVEVINRRDGSPFSEDDAELLSALANQAALVMENTRLLERLSERVVQSESDLAITNQHLRAEKNTLQTVLHSMTDGVVVTDNDGFIQLINPAAAALLPELTIEAIGRPLAELLPDVAFAAGEMLQTDWALDGASIPAGVQHSFNDKAESGVRQVLAARGEGRMAIQLIRGDEDAPHIIEAHSAPLRNEEGKPVGIVSVFADVTEQRGIEQAKSDFVSFVAHEMRSPLTSIAGFSSMLQRQESTPASTQNAAQTRATRARFLSIIHSESERLTRLINNLLDVARIEAGRGIELHREPTNFALIAEETVESQQAYSSRHQLLNSVPRSLPAVVADRDKVMQILINLISNALKYSPGGTIELSAQVDGKYLKISVRDEGPGIPPDQQEKLFQRFSRAPSRSIGSGQKAKPTGTGLGLFLTRYLVESHRGTIWVESEVGKGSTFYFTLPLA